MMITGSLDWEGVWSFVPYDITSEHGNLPLNFYQGLYQPTGFIYQVGYTFKLIKQKYIIQENILKFVTVTNKSFYSGYLYKLAGNLVRGR
jgi:hypothetical protein